MPPPKKPPVQQDDPPYAGPELNADTGSTAPFTIAGKTISGLVSADDVSAVVLLSDGSSATIPITSEAFAKVSELPATTIPPTVPGSVNNAQARAALRAAGLFSEVDSAITALNDPTVTDAWEYAPYINRDSILVGSLGKALGMTDEQIDGLFIAAVNIKF